MHIDFEKKLEQFYKNIIKNDDCVVDIGAHTGRHSVVFLELVGSNGKVVSFEPNPKIASILENNTKKWLDKGVLTIKKFATSNENKFTTFIIANDRPEESGLLERIYNGSTTTTTIDVEVISLDTIMNELNSLKFLKIDTEGAEFNTLLGAIKIIKKFNPIIAFEFGESSYKSYSVNPSEVFDFFSELNYEIYSIYGKKLNKQVFIKASIEQKFWDYIACHKNDIYLVEDSFERNTFFEKDKDIIYKVYQKLLNRDPDNGGLNYFINQLSSGESSIEEIENVIKNSDEYQLRIGRK